MIRNRNNKKIATLFISLCLLTGVLLGGCSLFPAQEPEETGPDPAEHVISHRGASGEETEHTFAAYDLAILYGSKNIEQDIVVSKDGTVYISHDRETTRLTGEAASFSDLTDAEIDALTVKNGEHFLKLEDVFKTYGDSINYIIEIKKRDDATVAAFCALVDQYEMADQIVVQCFNADILLNLEEPYPEMKKMYLVDKQEDFNSGLEMEHVDILAANKSLMTAENVDLAHQNNKQFCTFTINSTAEILQAINLGVDSYFTNYTAKALALEKEFRDSGLEVTSLREAAEQKEAAEAEQSEEGAAEENQEEAAE